MPRKKIKETTFINETIFKRIIKLKGYNIKTLMNNPGGNPSPVRRMEITNPFYWKSQFR